MPVSQLTAITRAIIVSRILYALSAWGGFLSVELCKKIMLFSDALRDLAISVTLLLFLSHYKMLTKIYRFWP